MVRASTAKRKEKYRNNHKSEITAYNQLYYRRRRYEELKKEEASLRAKAESNDGSIRENILAALRIVKAKKQLLMTMHLFSAAATSSLSFATAKRLRKTA